MGREDKKVPHERFIFVIGLQLPQTLAILPKVQKCSPRFVRNAIIFFPFYLCFIEDELLQAFDLLIMNATSSHLSFYCFKSLIYVLVFLLVYRFSNIFNK